jgi:hypothetical protein
VDVLAANGESGDGANSTLDQDRWQAKRSVDLWVSGRLLGDGANLIEVGGKAVHLPVPRDQFPHVHPPSTAVR